MGDSRKVTRACQRCRRQKLKVYIYSTIWYRLIETVGSSHLPPASVQWKAYQSQEISRIGRISKRIRLTSPGPVEFASKDAEGTHIDTDDSISVKSGTRNVDGSLRTVPNNAQPWSSSSTMSLVDGVSLMMWFHLSDR
jgi:hypothetical protein